MFGFAQNPNCGTNQFYGVGNSGTAGVKSIYSFTKSSSTITYNGVYLNGIPGGSLAIANLGNGERFYTNENDFTNNTSAILEYNGSTWTAIHTSNHHFQNAGGKGNYLYFHNIKSTISINEIYRFDGTNLTLIWADQSVFQPCADISVDNNGNVYFFTGATQYDVDTLNIISPNGAILAQIPISFEGFTGYGICFLNDIFHIAFQGSNSQFPNKLVPITIVGSTATIGTPITVPQPVIGTTSSGQVLLAMSDLASCSSANVTLTNSTFDFADGISFFSNSNQLNIHSKLNSRAIIFNVLGEKMEEIHIAQDAENSIDISSYSSGMYIVEFISDGQIAVKKFLKL